MPGQQGRASLAWVVQSDWQHKNPTPPPLTYLHMEEGTSRPSYLHVEEVTPHPLTCTWRRSPPTLLPACGGGRPAADTAETSGLKGPWELIACPAVPDGPWVVLQVWGVTSDGAR